MQFDMIFTTSTELTGAIVFCPSTLPWMYDSVFAQMLHLMPMLKPEDCTNLNHSRFLSHSVGFDFDFFPNECLFMSDKRNSITLGFLKTRLEMELILLTRCANMALATNLDSSELLNAGLTGGLVDC